MRTLVWFRGKELRVHDQAPLRDAAEKGDVVPLFVLDPYFFAPQRASALPHRMQFLLESIAGLAAALERLGSRLLLVEGRSVEVVPRLARTWKVDRVVAQRWVEPFGRERDRRISQALGNVPFELFEGETLQPPGTLRTQGGSPYTVFTPFARAFSQQATIALPQPAPRRLPPLPADVSTRSAALPKWPHPNPALPKGGESAGQARLKTFLAGPGARYPELRDRMDLDATSRLSADLKFGTLSPRTVWWRARQALPAPAFARFSNELVWREYTHSTLWDDPDILKRPGNPAWLHFPWKRDRRAYAAWEQGATGYPLVDAAARQLLHEGYVHNRARMISASFLTRHLQIDYRWGEAHYLKWLVDGDWAQNNAGWQWSAGCGRDAQPWFRVFNPALQGAQYDPTGTYVRRWLPELARLPQRYLHAPWRAPADVLSEAGVVLGKTYPRPIVESALARQQFVALARTFFARQSRASPGASGAPSPARPARRRTPADRPPRGPARPG